MKESIGLNFAAALRSFLRQDPNIILVGEIRDFETAEIAIKAALTGHLVLSTLHTNDAPSTISRLMNMGIEPFLVATSVNVIAAQRLIRRVCANCKEEVEAPIQALLRRRLRRRPRRTTSSSSSGRGCEKCNGTGYKGRVGADRGAWTSPRTSASSSCRAPRPSSCAARPVEEGMITLRESGPAEDPRRRHDDRGSGPRNRALRKGIDDGDHACTSCCKTMVAKRGATDLHITTNTPPVIRVDGDARAAAAARR